MSINKRNFVDEHRLLLAWTTGRIGSPLLQKKNLSHRIRQNALDQERNRIAHELHDGVTQQITHALHKIEYIQHLVQGECEAQILPELYSIQRTLYTGLQELRNTMSLLLSEQAEEVSLVQRIQKLVNDYQQVHQDITIKLKFIGFDELDRLSHQLSMAIFHCIQEALTNAWKHAQATSIEIQLHQLSHWLQVEIRDNGLGFERKQISTVSEHSERKGQHFGLAIMRERIEEAGGLWALQSRPGQGTIVRARFLIAEPISGLTKHQQEIFYLVTEGLSKHKIASFLKISVRNPTPEGGVFRGRV